MQQFDTNNGELVQKIQGQKFIDVGKTSGK